MNFQEYRKQIAVATRPGTLAPVLGVTVVVMAVLGVLSTLEITGAPFNAFRPSVAFTLPLLLSGALLLAAGLLAGSLGDGERPGSGRRRTWHALALGLALFSLAEAAALVERAGGGPRGAAGGVALLVAAAVSAGALMLLGARGPGRPAVAAGGALWVLAKLLGLLQPVGSATAEALEGLLEMAGPAALTLGLLAARRAQLGSPPRGEEGWWRLLAEIVARARIKRLALGIGALIGAFMAAGLLFNRGLIEVQSFNLIAEQVPAAIFAGTLSVAAGVLALLLARVEPNGDSRLRPPTVLGWFLIFLGFDEAAAVHEKLQGATGLRAQVVLLPLVAVGFLGWLGTVRRLSGRTWVRLLLAGGAACWVVAQAIDLTQEADNPFQLSIVPEEALEMTGSALFGFAMLLVVQAALRSREGPSSAHRDPGRWHWTGGR